MLIARAPLRISFGGGGTDLEAYYGRRGGLVISASINKYIYAIVTNNFDSSFQMISADHQSLFNMPSNGNGHDGHNGHNGAKGCINGGNELQLPRAVMEHFGLDYPVNIFMASEVPPGTGLGSSGAVAVNLVTIASTLCDRPITKEQVAETAYHVEVKKLGAPVGKQDQYASAARHIPTTCRRSGEQKNIPLPSSWRARLAMPTTSWPTWPGSRGSTKR